MKAFFTQQNGSKDDFCHTCWVESIVVEEEVLVTSIFSFSHNVLKILLSEDHENL